MKIGILTHSLGSNYGGILQNFALQTILKQLGHSPVTINHYSETKWYIKVLSVAKRLYRRCIFSEDVALRGWITKSEYEVITQKTSKFIDNYISLTPRYKLTSIKKLNNYGFEALIVGSDQVWRGKGRDVEHFFFYDFQKLTVPKIAYAASFGVDKWEYTSRQTRICQNLVKHISAISVREQSALQLCYDYFNVEAQFVLDPTLLLNKEEYLRILSSTSSEQLEQGLVVYVLDQNNFKRQVVSEISSLLQIKPVELLPEYKFGENSNVDVNRLVLQSVEDWLLAFYSAECVVTDSFHGTVFSIIFNKPFVVLINEQRGASRFYSLLDILGLRDRIVNKHNDIQKVLSAPIDWHKVMERLRLHRETSIVFLKSALHHE